MTPDKPFFVYFATGAVHAPHHVPREWADKYKGKFDEGWDKLREATLARQKKMGLIPENTKLPPLPVDIQSWDDLSAKEKKLFALQMEVFAAFTEQTDHEVGRLVDAIDEIGELDNTLIMFVSDNGASPEGGETGSLNEFHFFKFTHFHNLGRKLKPWRVESHLLEHPIKQLGDIHFLARYRSEDIQPGNDFLFWYWFTQELKRLLVRDQYLPALLYRQPPTPKGKRKAPPFELYGAWQWASEPYEQLIAQAWRDLGLEVRVAAENRGGVVGAELEVGRQAVGRERHAAGEPGVGDDAERVLGLHRAHEQVDAGDTQHRQHHQRQVAGGALAKTFLDHELAPWLICL